MASAMTDWGCAQFLAISLGLVSAPSVFWAAVTTDEPGTDTDGTAIQALEPSTSLGYARVSVDTGSPTWTDPTGTQYSTNTVAVDFGLPTGEWGSINHFALCDDDTVGNVYLYGEFDVPAEVNSTFNFAIPAGGLIIAFTAVLPSIVVT